MDDEAETYRLWRIRKTVMQVSSLRLFIIIVLYQLCLIKIYYVNLFV